MHDYPLLNVFWTLLYLFIWILWIFLLIRIITDIFRSADLSGAGKFGWTLVLILFPFIGALVYVLIRGTDMHTREDRQAVMNQQAMQRTFQQYGGSHQHSTADELSKLAALREQGVISDDEFAAQKVKLLG